MYNLPSQYIVILYIDSSEFLRCYACYWPTYFTLKSSTTKVKSIGWVLWRDNPDVMRADK